MMLSPLVLHSLVSIFQQFSVVLSCESFDRVGLVKHLIDLRSSASRYGEVSIIQGCLNEETIVLFILYQPHIHTMVECLFPGYSYRFSAI